MLNPPAARLLAATLRAEGARRGLRLAPPRRLDEAEVVRWSAALRAWDAFAAAPALKCRALAERGLICGVPPAGDLRAITAALWPVCLRGERDPRRAYWLAIQAARPEVLVPGALPL